MREKNKNENFIPSLRYDRTKLYFEKNYTPSNFRNESSKTYINKSLNTFNSRNTSYKNEFNLKSNEISHIKNNMKLNNNNELKHFSLSKIKDKSDIKFKSISNTKSSYKLKLNNTLQNTRNNSRIKYPVLKTGNNIINRKKVSYILKKFLNDNCSLKSDLKFGINIISSHLKDYKKEPKKKNEELNLDIGKIREELNLNKISPIIKESDILVKNEKKMEKKISNMREMLWWREEFRDVSTRFYYLIRVYTLMLAEQFEKEGMTMPSPHEIAKIYFYTAARTEGELKEMLQDKELPMMTRIIAKGVLDKRGLDVLEKIIDRAYGKEQRIDLTTNGKDLKPEPLVLKIVANKDEWEKISNEIPNIEDNEKK